jgi:hypothetical protein
MDSSTGIIASDGQAISVENPWTKLLLRSTRAPDNVDLVAFYDYFILKWNHEMDGQGR